MDGIRVQLFHYSHLLLRRQFCCWIRSVSKEKIPGCIIQLICIFLFVCPGRIHHFKQITLANNKCCRTREICRAIISRGNTIDKYFQWSSVPSIAITIVHGQNIITALRFCGVGIEQQCEQKKYLITFFISVGFWLVFISAIHFYKGFDRNIRIMHPTISNNIHCKEWHK